MNAVELNHFMRKDKNTIAALIRSQGGYARMKDFRKFHFQTREIARETAAGRLEKIKTGLYRVADPGPAPYPQGFLDACQATSQGVICLASALGHYELTDFNASEIYIALPRPVKPPKMKYPPLKVFYFGAVSYRLGREVHQGRWGKIAIYDREKTVCDMFRYRNKLGEDLAMEGLQNYLRLKGKNIPKLVNYARELRVEKVMMPYLKTLVR
jgi:predicted transcriptional regulator of viral defense system